MKLLKNHKLIVFFLLLIYSSVSFTSILNKSVTYDEIIYVSAGYSLWKTGDYRLNEEHPPLVKLMAGFPLLFINPEIPLDHESWTNDIQWEFSQEFFFNSGNNADLILFVARIPFILLGIVLGIYIFLFGKELYGSKAGLFALFLYVFSPNIIAHSRLATTDFLITAFIFITFYYFYIYLKNSRDKNVIFAGLFFGAAFASKFTSLYFIPVFFIIAFFHEYLKNPKLSTLKKKKFVYAFVEHCKKIIIIFIITFIFLFASYSFNLGPYIQGINQVIKSGQIGRFSYLMGEHYTGGNVLFYPIAFLVKTPLPFLLILFYSIFWRKKLNYKLKKDIFLFIPVIVFLLPTLVNKMNLGLRHLLIIYPFLHVYTGNVVNLKGKVQKILLVLLLFWYALSSLLIFPHYLSYFNLAIGGPSQGHKYLLDSNIDWGQDSKLLADYLNEENIPQIYLSYFGNDDLVYRGVNYTKLDCIPKKGIIAINVNNLYGIKKSEYACNKWLHEFRPYEKIGYTIWIYNISKDFTEEEINQHVKQFEEALKQDLDKFREPLEQQCQDMCREACEKQGLDYSESGLVNGNCGCSCS